MGKNNLLRTPKGTKDLSPKSAALKKDLINTCVKIFENHGASPIETPSFELREILQGKYGEDTKLIFNLEDQDGDICSLRYDLTVPFARYLSTQRVNRIRKYQIGSVYRRDNPSHGRVREFTQADFDICGTNATPLLSDAEVIFIADKIVKSINNKYNIGSYKIYVNSRNIVYGILDHLAIEKEMFDSICSSMDKVDKLSEKCLKDEFIKKGLTNDQAIELYRILKIPANEIFEFLNKTFLSEDKQGNNCHIVEEMITLFKYSKEEFGVESLSINLGLVRGLSYYTGMIFEVVMEDSSIGSIMGGGRYDNLCSSISNFKVPCVGFSVGITRVAFLIEKMAAEKCRESLIKIIDSNLIKDCLIASAYGDCISEKIKLFKIVSSCYKSEISPIKSSDFNGQIKYATKNSFRFIIFTGEKEKLGGVVSIYDVSVNTKMEGVKVENLIDVIKSLINKF